VHLWQWQHFFITANSLSLAANYDYIPVSYTLTFGPSHQSEQCVKIQIINDSLAEGWERFTVQLTTNTSAINITAPIELGILLGKSMKWFGYSCK